jgi:hypothetical protein
MAIECERMLAAEIYAVWPQSHYLPSKTRAAIDLLATEIPVRVGQYEDGEDSLAPAPLPRTSSSPASSMPKTAQPLPNRSPLGALPPVPAPVCYKSL